MSTTTSTAVVLAEDASERAEAMAAAEVDLELAPHGVRDAALQGAQSFLLRLALGELAVVERAAGGAGVRTG